MKQTWIFSALLLTTAASGAQPVPRTLDGGYRLVWHDEFDRDGRPDPTKWTYEEGFVRNREAQWYQADNAEVRDGVLVITGRREERPNPTYRAGATGWGAQRERIEYTSSCLITDGLYEFLYGRVEVRARIPAARGSWPAIWFKGATKEYPWPSRGEVDLMEYYPRQGQNLIHANACWGNDEGGSVWDSQAVPYGHFTARDSLWATRFHTWRMDWDKDFIRLYLDDELLNEIDLSKTQNGRHGHHDNPFRQPMFLLLNLAMGSSGGEIDRAALPMRYEVDYVRVYQKE